MSNLEKLEEAIKGLLWNSLSKDYEHEDRRQTGWGTKTLKGLTLCIMRVVEETGNGKDVSKA